MQWPPDVEEKLFELIRRHAQCGLKRRTWKAIHEQLLATVPRKGPTWSHLRLLIQDNEAQPIDNDRIFQIFDWQGTPETSGFWTMMNFNSMEVANGLFNFFMNPPGDANTDANLVAAQANVSFEVATEALANHDGDIVDAIMELTL